MSWTTELSGLQLSKSHCNRTCSASKGQPESTALSLWRPESSLYRPVSLLTQLTTARSNRWKPLTPASLLLAARGRSTSLHPLQTHHSKVSHCSSSLMRLSYLSALHSSSPSSTSSQTPLCVRCLPPPCQEPVLGTYLLTRCCLTLLDFAELVPIGK